ncbi:putative nucleic acid-binding Zn-ribbon protein [Conyzicola nivalis]|uniref:Nucleic acid-binding Zn-ribbon protein n=1 Tax=Conyzicola nivalis TaxID=1477021 RepID=A0ABV2QKB3_9MICO
MALTASPDAQARLLDLQALDTKIAQLTHRAKGLPQHAAIAALQSKIDALRIVGLEQAGAREDVVIELGRIESDVALVTARIKRDNERAQTSTSAKDAQAFEHELANLAKRQYDLEEIELTVMEKLEERESALAATTAEIDSLQGQIDVIGAERDAELVVLRGEIAAANDDRAAVAATVPDDLLALYDKQRLRYGVGASHLRYGVSSASGVKLLENEMAEIRAAAPDAVIMCATSEAILVRTKESGL